MKILLEGGTVYDGTGSSPIQADVFLDRGMIQRVLPRGGEGNRESQLLKEKLPNGKIRRLDVRGKAVAPGFIDAHRHGDFAVLTDPDFGEAELAQGITTVLFGNCGMSAVPTAPESRKAWLDFMEPCLGKVPEGKTLSTFQEYFQEVERQKAPLQTGVLVGIGSIKTAIKGFSSLPWSENEIRMGQEMIGEALEAGVMGISCGIMYIPESYSTTEEYVKLLKPAAAYRRPLCCHMRNEGDHLVKAVDEVIEIGQRTGLPINISHFKVFGRRNWKRTLDCAIEHIEKAREKGQDITVDFYPYTGGATTLMTLIPPCCIKETVDETLAFLSTEKGVALLRNEICREQRGWDNMVQSIGWERVLINYAPRNKEYQGLTVPQICQKMGEKDEAACMARILVEEQGNVGVIVMSMDPEDVDRVARLPYASVISDSLYGAPEFPHPRSYGAFPKVLREYVRERRIMRAQEAIHKMSGFTAKRFGMKDRGQIKEGLRADINVLDLEAIRDTATFQKPRALAEGMDYVIVNGNVVWDHGKINRSYPAGVLRADNFR